MPILQCVVRPRSPPVSHLLGHPLARNFRRCDAWCAQSRPPNITATAHGSDIGITCRTSGRQCSDVFEPIQISETRRLTANNRADTLRDTALVPRLNDVLSHFISKSYSLTASCTMFLDLLQFISTALTCLTGQYNDAWFRNYVTTMQFACDD